MRVALISHVGHSPRIDPGVSIVELSNEWKNRSEYGVRYEGKWIKPEMQWAIAVQIRSFAEEHDREYASRMVEGVSVVKKHHGSRIWWD